MPSEGISPRVFNISSVGTASQRTVLKPSVEAGDTANSGTRLITSARLASALLVAILVGEVGLLFFYATKKVLWYDELVTLYISGLQSFSLVWEALKEGADGTPPGYYILVRAARMLPGDPHATLLIPSIVGYLLTLLGVYSFTTKRLPPIAGLTAVLLIALSPFRAYALEARPYSLLIGFLALSAVCWQRIDDKQFATPLFAVFLALAVACHYLAVITILPFGIAELTRTLLARRIRWKVWAACLIATTPAFVSLPILLHYRGTFGRNFWTRSSWGMAVRTYGDYVGIDYRLAFSFVVILFVGLGASFLRALRPSDREETRDIQSRPAELIFISGFLLYPALLAVLTKLLGSGYTSRYGLPAVLGLVLGAVVLTGTLWLKPSSVYLLAALLIIFTLRSASDFMMVYKAGSIGVDGHWNRLAELSVSEPGIPVVIGSPLAYLQAVEYSPPEMRDRLIEVVDGDTAIRLVGTDTPDRTNRTLANFVPLHIEDLAVFRAAHRKFILRSGGVFDWLTQYLVGRRYHLSLLSKEGDISVYMAEQ
jgi:4-amino-4-deoxy-L-arabinose transferase-like glycosyltransferase